ncbi:MAG: translocation/assembly module TamB domain-containing protein [Bacteroidales bacterium]|nr:translocation/assembly module TamB domain-containing protein [Bacteroidales bacterium]
MYRKRAYIIARIVGLLAVLLMAALIAIQTPYVQTRLSKYALNQLAAIMDGRVQYDELKVMTSGVLVIRNIKLVDSAPCGPEVNNRGWEPADTVFKAKTVTATFTLRGLLRKEGLHLGRVTVEDGYFHLVSEPGEEYTSNIARIFHLKSNDNPPNLGNLFDIKKVRIKNFRFRMNSFQPEDEPYKGFGLNFEDLDLTADITAHGLRYAGGKFYGTLDRCSLHEKSGYELRQLEGIAEVGQGKILVEDLRLLDPWTNLNLRTLSMGFDDSDAFSDFVNKVRLEADFQRSQLAMQTLAYLLGTFDGNPTVLDIRRGAVTGFVNDLKVDRLAFAEKNSGISATLSGTCVGLPDIESLLLDVHLKELKGTTEGITRLANAFSPGAKLDFGGIAPGIPLTLNLQAKGPINRLDLTGDLLTPSGNARINGDVRNLVAQGRPMEASLNLGLDEFDLGAILGIDALGPVSLETRARALFGSGLPDATLDTLVITRMHALGRDFRNIRAIGSLQNGTVNARLVSADPAAQFDLTTLLDLTAREGGQRYRVEGSVHDADLGAFGVKLNDKAYHVSSKVSANLVRKGEFFDGNADLNGLRLISSDGTHDFGDLHLTARTEAGDQLLNLETSFLDASFAGNRQVNRFIEDLQTVTSRRELPSLYTDGKQPEEPGTYSLDLRFHDTRDLLALLAPGAYVADDTRLTLDLTDGGDLTGQLRSDRLAMARNYLKDVDIRFDNLDGILFANILSSELRAGSFAMKQPAITASADNDDLALGIHYDSFSGGGGNGEILLNGQLYRDADEVLVIKAHPLDSYLMTGKDVWALGESDIVLHGNELYLDHFLLSNGMQRLVIDGGYSPVQNDTLTLQMDRFDLALADQFLPNPLGIEGKMDGKAFIASGPDNLFGMLMDFRVDTLRLGGVDAGNLQLSSMWNDEGKELGIFLSDEIEGRDAILADGSYFPSDKRLDLRADLDRLPLGIASPFLTSIFSEMGGALSGTLFLKGPTDDLTPTSENLTIDDALLRIAYTGVPYIIRGPLRLAEDGLYFDSLDVRDDTNGKGTLAGALRFSHLKDFSLNGRLTLDNLKVVDARERPGSAFYGLLRASGSARVSGPFNTLLIDADLGTTGDGNIHIPLSGGLTSSSSDLLTFTEVAPELDPYEQMLASLDQKKADPGDLRIRGRVSVHPGVRAFVEIDKAAGNVASISGMGAVNLNIRPSKAVFEFNGDYNINEGSYQFVLPGVISKEFDVERGSSVKFGGDIMNTQLDVNAKYRLRTSLDALLGTSGSPRRQVECGISVSNRLRSPQLDLSVEVPDLDPSTRSQVESALNTTDKVQKQFVSLLLLGSFLPNETSGVFNQSNLLASNISEVMSSQINNILQRLDIPVDIGFGYQELNSGQNLFDVAVSTELFENRVIVGGSFGNRRYSGGGGHGDFAGDLDIQVKLDPEGQYRFNIFSHSADEFSSYLDFSQRNGIGVSFQKEYNSVGDFLRRLFSSKKKRQQTEVEEEPQEKEQVVIEIEENERPRRETPPDSGAPRGERSRRGGARPRP